MPGRGTQVRHADDFEPRPAALQLLVIALLIGAVEALIMLALLPAIAGRHPAWWTALDVAALLAGAAPLIYFLAYRPLRRQLAQLAAARDRALESEERLAEAQRIARLGHWELDLASGSLLWSEEMFRLFGRSPAAGQPSPAEVLEAVHAEDRERLRACTEAAAAGGGASRELDYRIILPGGAVRYVHEETRAVPAPGGRVLRLVGTTQDVTERTAAEQALLQDDELMRTLVALHEGADRLGLKELMDFGLEEMVRLTGSTIGYLMLYDEPSERLTLLAWSKAVAGSCRVANPPTVFELGRMGLWGEPIRRRRAVITNDCAAAGPALRGLPEGHLPLARHMGVPIFFEGRIVAVAGVGNRRGPYGPEEELQIGLFARGLWEIVQRKRREEEVAAHQRSLRWLVQRIDAAEEEERKRIAGELHDTIVQDLAAARLRLAALRDGEGPDRSAGARRAALEEVTGTLDGAIRYARALTYELSSPLLHQFGVEAALPSLVEQTGQRHGLAARCECEERLGVPPEQGALLYKIAQELLRNVVKHARARSVSVRLVHEGEALRLEVEDDGRGFVVSRPRSGTTEHGGFGLFSVRERLERIGGALRVETAPGRGTRVSATLPRAPVAQRARP